ncbi:MAG TPA: OmpA family protein [Usitatibacter sp.]|nr:OmpA family protein [Usitatibacter sp.]
MRPTVLLLAALAAPPAFAQPADPAPETNLASYAMGGWIVKHPRAYDESWGAHWLLDERPDSGWASPRGVVTPDEIVVQLAQSSMIRAVEFDTASTDGDAEGSRAAQDIAVEISDRSATEGFEPAVEAKLAARKDHQRFALATPRQGRWIRLRVKSNHGSKEYIELFEFRAFGDAVGKPAPYPSFTGAYRTNWGTFHFVQQGATITGCYEFKHGLVENGGLEGRMARFTWVQDSSAGPVPRGPAFFVFAPDGKEFLGLWWYEQLTNRRGELWNGTRVSDTPGNCAHWKGPEGASKQLAAQLDKGGHARIYGILFDLDSDRLRDDSVPALQSIAQLARENPSWRFVIEGHTDSTGGDAHNQPLSERRAAAVKAWLVKAGIAAQRLEPKGFGATRPVASNDTGMGRSQNRRVELVRAP